MARGRQTTFTITVPFDDQVTLLRWRRSTTIAAAKQRRAQIILDLAAGTYPITHIARRVGMTPLHVYKWIKRYQAEGLAGLVDRPQPPRRKGA